MSQQKISPISNSVPTLQDRNAVLDGMFELIGRYRVDILEANQKDLVDFDPSDRAMYDRLIVNDKKIEGMMAAVRQVRDHPDPLAGSDYAYTHPKGMKIENRKAPFGTILIIYESRPDVTVEAASIAFKAGNRILLKGGKEAIHTNEVLTKLWHKALRSSDLSENWIRLLTFDRAGTQRFLQKPAIRIDLIVPRGGEGLIRFVKENGTAPVLVSGRGNNFLFIHKDVDWGMVIPVILNAKTDKISACNALDKVLFDAQLPDLKLRMVSLQKSLEAESVEVLLASDLREASGISGQSYKDSDLWYEEFLSRKILIDVVEDLQEAVHRINRYSGGHSASILTSNEKAAKNFMDDVDAAAVYHNASTRFTDGGEFGMGAELAISTDKLHHRGPLGLNQLVTNKYYIYGSGQTR